MLQRDSTDLAEPDARRALDLLSAQVDADADTARRQIDQQAQEAAITRAVGDPEAFRRAMQGYVDRFKDAPRTGGFSPSTEARLWNEIDDWNSLIDTWGSAAPTPVDPKRAGQEAAAIKTFCGKYPQWPGNASLLSACLTWKPWPGAWRTTSRWSPAWSGCSAIR